MIVASLADNTEFETKANECQINVNNLEKAMSDAVLYLPPYDMKIYQEVCCALVNIDRNRSSMQSKNNYDIKKIW